MKILGVEILSEVLTVNSLPKVLMSLSTKSKKSIPLFVPRKYVMTNVMTWYDLLEN